MENLKGKTILLVDDEERNTFALKNYLETFGIEMIVAENGELAMSLLQSGADADMILLDMMMPVMDGYEVLDALKSDAILKSIPVIAVTARAMKGDKEKCMEHGAWDYVSKPIDLHDLMNKINDLIG
jgi:two-component system chemotaxis sensor kinase CheA